MSRYRMVDVKVWGDSFFTSLSDDAKLLWIYLLTSPQTTSCGIYRFSSDLAAQDLHWTTERFGERFRELFRVRLGEQFQNGYPNGSAICYDERSRVVFLPNWFRYNTPANPNTIKSWVPILEGLPEDCALISRWYRETVRYMEQYREPLLEPFRQRFTQRYGEPMPEHMAELQEQEQEQEQERERFSEPFTPPPSASLDTSTHAPAQGKEPPPPDREWIVRSEWTAVYDAHYGHPPAWNAKGHGEAARRILSYMDGLARKRGVEVVTEEMLRRGIAKAVRAFLANQAPMLATKQHPFEWLANDIHIYLHKEGA